MTVRLHLLGLRERFGRAEVFLGVSLGLLTVAALVVSLEPKLIGTLDQLFGGWQRLAVRYGYLGVFLSMLIGNLTIVIILPTTVVPFLVAATGLNPFFIALLSGLGAELGELLGYLIGRWGSRVVERHRPEGYTAVRRIIQRRPRAIPLLLYFFSTLPLPDDILFVPLGVARYPFWKLLWPSLAGKVTAGLAIAFSGVGAEAIVAEGVVTLGSVLRQIGFLAAIVVFFYLLLKIRWTAVLRRFSGG